MAKKKRRVPGSAEKAPGTGETAFSRLPGAGKPGPACQADAAEAYGGGGGSKILLLWGSALALIASGYYLLSKVDPGGQNAWAVAAPALLLSGYLLIIPSIFLTYRGKP